VVKNPPAKAEDVYLIPGQEDLLEKEMATHSSILAWDIPWTKETGGLQSIGVQDMVCRLTLSSLRADRIGLGKIQRA
jgi:hypothetical protein